jgi:hypothetical protein
MARVWANSAAKGSALLLLLAVADHAHDDGSGAWPSVATLARKCRLDRRQIQRLLRRLEASGELLLEQSPGRTHLMTVLIGGDKMTPPAETGAHGGGVDVAPGMTRMTPQGGVADAPLAVPVTPKPSSTVLVPIREPPLGPSELRRRTGPRPVGASSRCTCGEHSVEHAWRTPRACRRPGCVCQSFSVARATVSA